jgi:hypothetical protein
MLHRRLGEYGKISDFAPGRKWRGSDTLLVAQIAVPAR